mgnify:CR=1 FL=1
MTGFLASNGEVFFCGSGLHGRLGTGDENECIYPVRISIPGDDKVVKVSPQAPNSSFTKHINNHRLAA